MRLTDEQFNALAPFEENFRTAVKSGWARRPSTSGLETIHSIYSSVTNIRIRLNGSCQSCILNLLRDCGKIYFKDKDERKAIEAKKVDEAIEAKMAQASKGEEQETIPKTPQNGRKNPRKLVSEMSGASGKENARKRTKKAKRDEEDNI